MRVNLLFSKHSHLALMSNPAKKMVKLTIGAFLAAGIAHLVNPWFGWMFFVGWWLNLTAFGKKKSS